MRKEKCLGFEEKDVASLVEGIRQYSFGKAAVEYTKHHAFPAVPLAEHEAYKENVRLVLLSRVLTTKPILEKKDISEIEKERAKAVITELQLTLQELGLSEQKKAVREKKAVK